MGGNAEAITTKMQQGHHDGMPLGDGLKLAVQSLASAEGEPRTLPPQQLEVAVLDRTRPRRKFRRFTDAQTTELLTG
jgi:proteasome alpha subunit